MPLLPGAASPPWSIGRRIGRPPRPPAVPVTPPLTAVVAVIAAAEVPVAQPPSLASPSLPSSSSSSSSSASSPSLLCQRAAPDASAGAAVTATASPRLPRRLALPAASLPWPPTISAALTAVARCGDPNAPPATAGNEWADAPCSGTEARAARRAGDGDISGPTTGGGAEGRERRGKQRCKRPWPTWGCAASEQEGATGGRWTRQLSRAKSKHTGTGPLSGFRKGSAPVQPYYNACASVEHSTTCCACRSADKAPKRHSFRSVSIPSLPSSPLPYSPRTRANRSQRKRCGCA